MKKFLLWIVVSLIGIVPAMADKIQFTINVPNPDAVKCEVGYQAYELQQGANSFDVDEYTSIMITGKGSWYLSGVTDKNGTTANGYYNGTWNFYPSLSSGDQGKEFTLLLTDLDENRTSQFTLNVDDPSLVNAVLSGYYTTIQLEAGENIIKYDPDYEKYLTISPTNYNTPLYSVKKDGVDIPSQGNSYMVELEENCEIDVEATLPEEDCTISFSYSEEGSGAVSVSVNYSPVTDFNNETLVVKLGDWVQINGNSEYKINQVKIDGEPISWYSSYSFYVMKDTEVYVDAAPFGTVKATVVIDNPDNIIFYKGYSYNDDIVNLTPGPNEIELPENDATVSWTTTQMGIIESITLNEEDRTSASNAVLANGDVLTFKTSQKEYNQTVIVWMDNSESEKIKTYFSFGSNSERVNFTINSGYNELAFYKQMNPFSTSWYGGEGYLNGKVYLNDVLQTPLYENSTSYELTIENNDVVKFFMDEDPVDCNVAFEIAEDAICNVVKDIVTAVDSPESGFGCFAGTQVSITGKDLKVLVNNDEVDAAAPLADEPEESPELTYTFTVDDPDTNVTVKSTATVSVISVEAEKADSDVYNAQGIKIGKKSQLGNLQPGLYIVDGKKIYKGF